jgi:hypothetical protein
MNTAEAYHNFVLSIGKSMLWYPVAYIALLLPYSVTRVLVMFGFRVPSAIVMFAFTCWYLLGVVNVLLLYNTFRLLVPALDLWSAASNQMDPKDSGTSILIVRGDMEKEVHPSTALRVAHHSPPVTLDRSMASEKPFSPQSRPFHPNYDASTRSNNPFNQSDRGYHLRTISPVSQLNEQLASISPPAPAILRSRADLLRSPPTGSQSLPSAPRYTRSPIVRYPTIENIGDAKVEAGSRVNNLQAVGNKQTPKAFERDSFGVSPPHSRQFGRLVQSPDSSVSKHVSYPSLSPVASWSSSPGSPAITPYSGNTTNGNPRLSPSPVFAIRLLPSRPSHTHSESNSSQCEVASATSQLPPVSPFSRTHMPSSSGSKYYF